MGVDEDLTHPDEPRGIDVFSDEEILKSERWYDRKNNSALSVQHPPSYEVCNYEILDISIPELFYISVISLTTGHNSTEATTRTRFQRMPHTPE